MKKTEFLKEIKAKSVGELGAKSRSLADELMKMRFRRVTGQVEKPHLFRELRRNLARVETLISKTKGVAGEKIVVG